jgi:hypothetical protein
MASPPLSRFPKSTAPIIKNGVPKDPETLIGLEE